MTTNSRLGEINYSSNATLQSITSQTSSKHCSGIWSYTWKTLFMHGQSLGFAGHLGNSIGVGPLPLQTARKSLGGFGSVSGHVSLRSRRIPGLETLFVSRNNC